MRSNTPPPSLLRLLLPLLLLLCNARRLVGESVPRRIGTPDKQIFIQIPGYTPTETDEYVSVSLKAEPGYISKWACRVARWRTTKRALAVEFEPYASADRVHHMLLYGCDQPAFQGKIGKGGMTCAQSSHILYAWARNAPAFTLPADVGFAIGNKEDSVQWLVLQIHYAQPFEGAVKDFTGVLLKLTNVKPTNLAAVYLFVSGEEIPPRQAASYNNISCAYSGEADLHPFAFRTHTHGMGRLVSGAFKHGDKWSLIGKRSPQWPQLFQESAHELTIRKGDFMAAMCRFDSHDKDDYTPMGWAAVPLECALMRLFDIFSSMGVNEMCNFYMMFYRSADSPDPFPYGAMCGYNENPELVAREYPHEGTTLLKRAHQSGKKFGVIEKARITKIGAHTLGQIAGIAYDGDGRLFVFHRASRVWDATTFGEENKLRDQTPIAEPTLLVATQRSNSLSLVSALGAGEFYLPHGIFVDDSDHIYTTDVGSHQVIKWRVRGGEFGVSAESIV